MKEQLTSDGLCIVCGEHANEHLAIPGHQFQASQVTKEEQTMKCYEVTVTTSTIVFVADAASLETAYECAREEFDLSSFGNVEMAGRELTDDQDIATTRRHADVVSQP